MITAYIPVSFYIVFLISFLYTIYTFLHFLFSIFIQFPELHPFNFFFYSSYFHLYLLLFLLSLSLKALFHSSLCSHPFLLLLILSHLLTYSFSFLQFPSLCYIVDNKSHMIHFHTAIDKIYIDFYSLKKKIIDKNKKVKISK